MLNNYERLNEKDYNTYYNLSDSGRFRKLNTIYFRYVEGAFRHLDFFCNYCKGNHSTSIQYYVRYLAFLNQIASIVDKKEIRMSSVYHFIFSGADGLINAEQTTLMKYTHYKIIAQHVDEIFGPLGAVAFWASLRSSDLESLFKGASEKTQNSSDVEQAEKREVLLVLGADIERPENTS